MIPQSCVKIETTKFPVLDGEEDELVNEGMYGKSLGLYLKDSLPEIGIKTNGLVCEDWGWWLDVESGSFKMGLCLYCDPDSDGDPKAYAILPSIQSAEKWSWKKFGKIDQSQPVVEIMNKIASLLESDHEISKVSRHDDFMF